MKPLEKSTIREIKNSLGRYLAIFAIVALGVVMFAGLRICKKAMLSTANSYLEENEFYDYRLLSTIGFERDDITAIKEAEGVVDVESAVAFDVIRLMPDGSEKVVAAHSITESINKLVVTEGRLPQNDNECVIDSFYESSDLIGTEFVISDGNSTDTLEHFKYKTYTIVGTVQSPYYLNFERGSSSIGNGAVGTFVYMPREAFVSEYDTEIFVRMDSDAVIYSDEYKDYIKAHEDDITFRIERAVTERFDRLVAEGEAEIEDAKAELDEKVSEAESELSKAYEELLEGERKLEEAKAELSDARQEIEDGEKKLSDGELEIIDAEQEIASYEAELEKGEKEIAEAKQKIAENETKIEDGEKKLSEAQTELTINEAVLTDGEKKLDESYAEILKKAEELKESKETLNKNKEELTKGIDTLEGTIAILNIQISSYTGVPDTSSPLYPTYATLVATREKCVNDLNDCKENLVSVDEALNKIEEGEQTLANACMEIAEKRSEIEEGRQKLNQGKIEFENKKQELIEGRKELEEGKVELLKAQKELEEGKAELLKAQKELEEGKQELVEAGEKLEKGKKEYQDALIEFDDAKKKLADGYDEYEDGKKTLQEEIADAKTEIADAEEKLSDLKKPEVYVLGRNTNNGYVCFENDSNIVNEIAAVFPIFFFAVAVLVCMTTMTRMIEDQRTQIGILKALGYKETQIMGKYLFYSASAAISGAVVGFFLGTIVFPKVIWVAYGMMYGFARIKYVFDPALALISIFAAIICSFGATYISCASQLLSVPASLIRPKAPKSGKRIFLERVGFIWKRLKFLQKVSIRNVFRYRKRFIMMVLGISGCTALLVTAMGLNDSIKNVVTDQYDEISIYDVSITLSEAIDGKERSEFEDKLSGYLESYVFLYVQSRDILADNGSKTAYVVVPEDKESLSTKYLLYDSDTGKPLDYPGINEAVITGKMADKLGVSVGDSIIIQNSDMQRIEVIVSGICKNYVYSYVFITKETYENQMGVIPEYKTIYADFFEGADEHEAAARISDMDEVASCTVSADFKERFTKMMNSLNYIIIMVVICAAALAFIVLYNLTNINITERIREIATIKVLGFYPGETASYVFRENMILTTFGVLLGLFLGKYLHLFVMNCIDIDVVSFGMDISLFSYVLSVALTYLFACLVNNVMRIKLRKINMAESLKSIE